MLTGPFRRGIIRVMRTLLAALCFIGLAAHTPAADPADLIVHNAKVVTVNAKFTVAEAVAVRGGKVVAVGANEDVLKLWGPKTRSIDAAGKTPRDLALDIQKRLKEYLSSPSVTVIVKEVNSLKAYLTGEVVRPVLA